MIVGSGWDRWEWVRFRCGSSKSAQVHFVDAVLRIISTRHCVVSHVLYIVRSQNSSQPMGASE